MDVGNIFAGIEKLAGSTETTEQKQNSLNVSDVWHLWEILVSKYDALETINIFINFVKDEDLKYMANYARKAFEAGIIEIEKMMVDFAIPLPQRPPKTANSTINLELITDKFICRNLIDLFKQILPVVGTGFNSSGSTIATKFYKNHMDLTMKLIDNLSIYGNLKGYLHQVPKYLS